MRGWERANRKMPHRRLIQYCTNTKDFMVPSMWGSVSQSSAPVAVQCIARCIRQCASRDGSLTVVPQLGRPKRRPIRAAAKQWLLRDHVNPSCSELARRKRVFRIPPTALSDIIYTAIPHTRRTRAPSVVRKTPTTFLSINLRSKRPSKLALRRGMDNPECVTVGSIVLESSEFRPGCEGSLKMLDLRRV